MLVKFYEKKSFLHVELSDGFIYDSFIEFLKLLGTKDSLNILIDATKLQNTDLSYKERYELGNIAIKILNKKVKFVVIWPLRDINYFAISIMKLRGFNIRVFAKTDIARQWLLH